MTNLIWRNGLDRDETDEVLGLLDEAARHDGVAAVGESVLLRLAAHAPAPTQVEPVQGDLPGSEHFLIRLPGGELAGYAHLDASGDAAGRSVAELTVRPTARGRGLGTTLVRALTDRTGSPAGSDRLRVWAHGGHPAASAIAERLGLRVVRELLSLSRPLTGADRTVPTPPAGVTIRSFQPGRDERELVAVNNRAFARHPEQGTWTVADVELREKQDWFDPEGLLLAIDHDGRLLGFHWTKIHSGNDARIGEVYVLGIDPDTQGRGLGRLLTSAGLAYLSQRGLNLVTLYVESDNSAALAVYEKAGFARSAADYQFSW